MTDHSTTQGPHNLAPSALGGSSLSGSAPEPSASSIRQPKHALKLPKILLLTAAILAFAFLALVAGFFAFSSNVLLSTPTQPQQADAIVVVTGGKGRLETAGTLLNQGLGKRLLISGVHPKFRMKNLPQNLKVSPENIKCCIDLDRKALNTVGNATQTALWAQKHQFGSLIIVTSAYHMSRTLLEMRRAAPELALQSYAVAGENNRSFWARLLDGDTLMLLVKEYSKLLVAFFQLSSERLAN
ncbi:MAG: YdcF family protein [Cohaesibacter sp.]|jgi:uncharacterized SAM-binding protein YcdF (DUF218 family)|nr:YdcF family protein [Cohaesibacter sp.]